MKKDVTFEQLIVSPNYQQLRNTILKEINQPMQKVDKTVFKKTDDEKAALFTAKRNWKGNDKEFLKEFFAKDTPNFGNFKFNGISLN